MPRKPEPLICFRCHKSFIGRKDLGKNCPECSKGIRNPKSIYSMNEETGEVTRNETFDSADWFESELQKID